MRRIGVVTVARSDYGIYRPILEEIRKSAELQLHLIVGGMHLSPLFGHTVEEIEEDGFDVAERVEMTLSSDSPAGVSKSIGIGVQGFSQVYERADLDILVVLGDRYEMLAAAAAALPFSIPMAHIHGGEATHGAIDDPIRHSLTKMSHLHFVSTDEYRRRVVQMGEDPDHVIATGAPALDNLHGIELKTADQLEKKYGFRFDTAPLVVTYHPVTVEHEDTEEHVNHLLRALSEFDRAIVITYPNADTKGAYVRQRLEAYASERDRAWIVDNLGTQDYFSLLDHAAAMVGNSSSGIIEAATFELPVVDVGSRQAGRVRGRNVIDVGYGADEIQQGIEEALDSTFRRDLHGMENPYGDGEAASQIVEELKDVELGRELIMKGFHDIRRGGPN